MQAANLTSAWRLQAEELRDSWQAQALRATITDPVGMVLLSIFAHNYDEPRPGHPWTWRSLMAAVFPGFVNITPPFLASAGRIDKSGRVTADVVWEDFSRPVREELFADKRAFERKFRKLADNLALSDGDRRELFALVRAWIVQDQRLDPTMDPRDPDAVRLHS